MHALVWATRAVETTMPLKVELKPRERIFIGEALVTNGDQRAHFLIDGHAPVLREKDIITADGADTPGKRVYLAVQLMYLAREPMQHHDVYFALVRDLTAAAPSTWPYVENINNQILTGNLYKALKEARKLIAYEEKLLNHGKRNSDLRSRIVPDRKSA
jgi:flagellar biosynthesis repressor protein FlbT